MGGVLKGGDEDKKAEKQAKIIVEQEKKKSSERLNQGMENNIRTSYNGILGNNQAPLQRKKLLGE